MKKIFRNICLIISLLAMAVSFVGCTFYEGDDTKDDDIGGSSQSYYGTTVNLPDSKTLVGNVEYATVDRAREDLPMNLQDAVNTVRRSSVAIFVTSTSDGTTVTSAGSGIIVDLKVKGAEDPNVFYILTCHHVIDSLGSIIVHVPDENFRYGESDKWIFKGTLGGNDPTGEISLVGGDKYSDVAVIKLDISERTDITSQEIYKAPVISQDYSVSYGEEVFAIGNPGGAYPGTLSVGYVSYVNRISSVSNIGKMDLIQINVNTDHGSSGGGLYNLYGELVGITNAGNDDYKGINFAIPSKIAVEEGEIDNGFVNIATQLLATASAVNFKNYGYVSGRAELFGFTVSSTDNTKNGSIYVAGVTSGSVAEKAGLLSGDIIVYLSVNDVEKDISTYEKYTEVMASLKIGDVITMKIDRTVTSGRWRTTITKTIGPMAKSQYYFADTGVYPSND